MRHYKDNLQYNPEWKKKWLWMEYSEEEGGMFCSVCKKHGNPPVQSRGAEHGFNVQSITGSKLLNL